MALTDEGIIDVPGMLSRWVRLPNGTKAHYTTSGTSGPAVILMHGGITGSSGLAGWRYMAPFLGDNGFRVYCPDYPGFGLTENYEEVYAPGAASHVDFTHDLATALCLDKFHLSGNSMGCANAVNYITAHPERVLNYALIAGSIGEIVPWSEIRAKDTRTEAEKPNIMEFDGTPESMKALMSAIILDPSKITEDLTNMRTLAANKNRDYYAKFIHAWTIGADENAMARLNTKGRFDRMVSIPGIYLYGTEDVLWPHTLSGYMQEDALSHVQFFYPENTGHQGQTDQPELFNQVFLEFFRDGKVSWATAQKAGISTRRPPLPNLVEVPEGMAV